MELASVLHPLVFLLTSILSLLLLRGLIKNKGAENLSTMKWKSGDVLTCILDRFWAPLGGEHWMLALDEDTVIHLVKPNFFKGLNMNKKGHIRAHTRDEIRFKHDKCHNYGKTYDKPVSQALEDARKYINKEVYINVLFCNCQHWVNKVTKGYPGFSSSSLMWAVPWCRF